ncbi:hypothetical protein MUP77_15965 [Candidatus Bathyarchaeota archaeon]|nr:hypothetical protein [Candidatus Bathyarchaeota archaeon]
MLIVQRAIEDRLISLKQEKPKLFYISDAEKIAKLGALILNGFFLEKLVSSALL